jgi:autotransporter-associated beta strand protein
MAPRALAQNVWIAGATGTFSNNANWLGGFAPTFSSSATVTFNPGNIAAATSATQDLAGTLFPLNAMTFNNLSVPNALLVGNNPSSSKVFEFDPAPLHASISLQGYGLSQTSSGIAGSQMKLTTDLMITGSGMGNLTLNNPIFEDGTPRRITVASTPATQITGIFTLASAGTVGSPALITTGNTFSGDLFLDGGNLGWSGGGPGEFGTGRFVVTANGGTLFMNGNNSAAGARFTTMQLDGALRIVGTSSGALNLLSPTGESPVPHLTGSGPLLISGQTTNTLSVSNDSSGYTGTITLDRYDFGQFTGTAGGVQIASTNGNLRGVSTFNIRDGGVLAPTNSVPGQSANLDRIANTATINLSSGTIRLIGTSASSTAQVNVTEVLGTVNSSGFSTFSVESGGTTGVTNSTALNIETLWREDRGTFLFRGNSLNAGTLAPNATPNSDGTLNFDGSANTSYIVLPSALTASLIGGDGSRGTNKKILPFAVGDAAAGGPGSNFVTLDLIAGAGTKVSVHPFSTADYATIFGGDPTDNVQLTTATTNNDPVTVNSLMLTNSGTNHGSVTGSGTITVTSGAVLTADASTAPTIANNINFGATEGFFVNPSFGGANISGNLTGTGGLTKSGGGSTSNTLFLRGDNSGLTGQLTLNAGPIDFNSANALPGTGQIVSNGAAVGTTGPATGLHYTGTVPYTLSRDIAANSGWLTLKALDTAPGVANLTITGQISGNAGLNYQATANGADIYIAPAAGFNTYTGPTRISAGSVHFASDACLGSGGAVSIEGATVVLENDWKTNRIINNGGATINTNGHNAVWNGPLINFNSSFGVFTNAGLTKTGLGALTLNSDSNNLGGTISVLNGTLYVNCIIPGSANGLTVSPGATLGGHGTICRNASIVGTLAPGNSPGVITFRGNLTMVTGSILSMQLNGPAAGSGYDQVVVASPNTTTPATVALGAGTSNLAVSLGFAPSAGSKFWLISNASSGTTTGNFNGLPEGAIVTLGAFGGHTYTAQISYNANFDTGQVDHSGNDVVLYNISRTPQCGSVDFNCDGDVGTDADIEAFFACLSGTCPSLPCTSDADFNYDGDVGTDADIEAFFRVLGGGAC